MFFQHEFLFYILTVLRTFTNQIDHTNLPQYLANLLQNQPLRTNVIKAKIEKQQLSPLCNVRFERRESGSLAV